MACNSNCRIKHEGLLKVTDSYVHCESGNISEILQEGDAIQTTDRAVSSDLD